MLIGGSAEKAGLKVADQLLSVNGAPVGRLALAAVQQLLDQNARVSLVVETGMRKLVVGAGVGHGVPDAHGVPLGASIAQAIQILTRPFSLTRNSIQATLA